MTMSNVWYNDLGFDKNPFSIKPVDQQSTLIGYDSTIKEIQRLVREGNFVFISGEYGRGKTSVLKRIIKRFSGKRTVAYFSGNQIDRMMDVDKILIEAGGFFSRLFKMRTEDVILLLDEVQDINQNDADAIMEAYDEGFIKSVVVVSAAKPFEEINTQFNGLFEDHQFELNGFSADDAVSLIRKRVGNLPLLPDEMIKKIYKHDENPRSVLKNCEDVCRYAVEQGADTVTDEQVEKVLKY